MEAIAATIGKYIHPGGQFSSAREELQNRIMKPYSTDDNGKDTLIYAHVPSVDPQKVEDVFFLNSTKLLKINDMCNFLLMFVKLI